MENKHLSEQEVAKVAEALANDTYEKIETHLRQHIAECNDCAEEVLQVTQLLGSVSQNQTVEDKEELSSLVEPILSREHVEPKVEFPRRKNFSKNQFRNLGIAASLLLACTIASQRYFDRRDNGSELASSVGFDLLERDIDEVELDSQIQPINTELVIYRNHDSLEKLSRRFESPKTAFRNHHSVGNIPAVTVSHLNSLSLAWENNEKLEYTIQIFDNSNLLVKELTTQKGEVHTSLAKEGLYYWKLLSNEYDLVFCGKIYCVK